MGVPSKRITTNIEGKYNAFVPPQQTFIGTILSYDFFWQAE